MSEHWTEEVLGDRKAWLAARRQGIGGSDAPVVVGLSPWKSPTALYAEKLELIGPDEQESEALEMGLRLEPVIRDIYRDRTGRKVIDPAPWSVRRSTAHPFMTFSPDGFAVRDGLAGGLGVLQIKTTSAFKSDEWEEEPPAHYLVQLQHEIAVQGATWGSLAVLIGGQRFKWFDVERHDRFIASMVDAEASFWGRLLAQEPPPIDGSDASKEMLARLHPRHSEGLVVNLPGEATEWDAQRLNAIAVIRTAEDAKQLAENHIKAAIGDAEAGVLPDGTRYSWKAQERKGYTVEASVVRALRRSVAKGGR